MILTIIATSTQAQVTFTVDAPGVQASTVAGVTTETFDTQPIGSFSGASAVGTFSAGGRVLPADIYGGANGSDYYQVLGTAGGPGSSTLTLNTPTSYFGMWWGAEDAGNVLKFYDGSTLIGDFTTASIAGSLSSAYKGNPNNGGDSGEPFAYINFTPGAGEEITSVQFSETIPTFGFELDNISVLNNTKPVPDESSSAGLLAGAGACMLAFQAYRKLSQPISLKS